MRSFFVKEIIYIAQALRVWAFFFSLTSEHEEVQSLFMQEAVI